MSIDREVVKNLEEALKVVDDSDIPPAPVYDRPPQIRSERSEPVRNEPAAPKSEAVDKYGIPIPSQSRETPVTAKKDSLRSVKPSGVVGIPHRAESYDISHDIMPVEALDEEALDVGSPDFKMKFDFESAYRNVPDNRPLRLRREKRTGLIGGLLLATFIICVSLVLASIAWMATTDILGFTADDELVSVQIPPDFTLEGVTDILYEAGLIRYRALFTLYAEYSEAIDKISSGSYVLNKNYDYRALVQGMTARAGVRVETSVTIPEGFTLAQIFALLEAEEVCSADELWEAATNHDFRFHFLDEDTLGNRLRLEGYLFPDTYNFYKDSTPVQAILRMLREFDRRFTEEFSERALYLGYSIHEIMIIASMVEREAGDDDDDRAKIAAVIYNRLDSPEFPRLQIDATIDYAIAGTGIPFSTQFESEFNTYLHEGLPPGPIANPGMAAIRAALWPATTNDFFYALNREGTHNFFTNYNDHVNFVNSDEFGGR